MALAPCRNENCNSYGQPHPNCQCYGGFAHGGQVEDYCSLGKPHESKCGYAKGGFVVDTEDESHYVLKHPSGDLLKVAKKGLSPELQEKIRGFAKGGAVKKEAEFPRVNPELPKTDPELPKVDPELPKQDPELPKAHYAMGTNQGPVSIEDAYKTPTGGAPQAPVVVNVNSGPVPQTPLQPQAPAAPVSAQSPQPMAMPPAVAGADYTQDPSFNAQLKGHVADTSKGINQEAQAKGAYWNAMAPLQQQQGTIEQQYQNDYAQSLTEQANETKNILDEYARGLLDFNKAWQSKATGNKIMAGLGIFMSGIGSGMTGQPNLALQVINSEIENDLKMQEQATKGVNTVLGMYEKYYGSKHLAMGAAKVGALAMVAAKANELLSKQNASLSEAERLQKLAPFLIPIETMIAQNAAQAARRKTILGLMGQGAPMQQFGMGQPGTGNATMPPQSPQKPSYTGASMTGGGGGGSQATSTPTDNGISGEVDYNLIELLEQDKFLTTDQAKAAREDAKEYTDLQADKAVALQALDKMMAAVEENKQGYTFAKDAGAGPLGILDVVASSIPGLSSMYKPLEVRKFQKGLADVNIPLAGNLLKPLATSENKGGKTARDFEAAEEIAKAKVSTLLNKRVGTEKQQSVIGGMFPDNSDATEQMVMKRKAIADLYDAEILARAKALRAKGLLR